MSDVKLIDKKRRFWDERAMMKNSGSNDFILKRLETKLILETVPRGSRVLDVGCGVGEALIALAINKNCTGCGIDFSMAMVKRARAAAKKAKCDKKISFYVGRAPGLPKLEGKFDYILTERCLVNMMSRTEQKKAFLEIMSYLRSGGHFLMIEDYEDGLASTNKARKALGLYKIDQPWHNIFLNQKQIDDWASKRHVLKWANPFSSTYYFLSRVVYAAVAKKSGKKLKYDSDINLLALKLPIVGDFGATKAWLWQKKK